MVSHSAKFAERTISGVIQTRWNHPIVKLAVKLTAKSVAKRRERWTVATSPTVNVLVSTLAQPTMYWLVSWVICVDSWAFRYALLFFLKCLLKESPWGGLVLHRVDMINLIFEM
jgi:hypothetical protein